MFQEYFKKRLAHVEHLPTALQAVNKQLFDQNALKTSVENTVEILSNKLKAIVIIDIHMHNNTIHLIDKLMFKYLMIIQTKDPGVYSTKNSKKLAKLREQNLSIK